MADEGAACAYSPRSHENFNGGEGSLSEVSPSGGGAGALSAVAVAQSVLGTAADWKQKVGKMYGTRHAESLEDGLFKGAASIGKGFAAGVGALISKPIEGAARDGTIGFLRGAGAGITGAVVLPTIGVVHGVRQVGSGLKNMSVPTGVSGTGVAASIGALTLGNRSSLAKDLQAGKFRQYSVKEVKELTADFSQERVLGKGGFAIVFLGEAAGSGRGSTGTGSVVQRVAVKVHKEVTKDFQDEVATVSKLSHPNLVRLLGYSVDKLHDIALYEYAPGGSLKERLQGPKAKDSPLTMKQRVAIARGSVEGLRYLHRCGIIHRDIKPDNILLMYDSWPKLADFGIMRKAEDHDQGTLIGSMFTEHLAGTRGYLDPEYFEAQRLSSRVDVFSMGVVLLELITGQKTIVHVEPSQRPQLQNSAAESSVSSSDSSAGASQSLTFNSGSGTSEVDEDMASSISRFLDKMSWTQSKSEEPTVMHLGAWAAEKRRLLGPMAILDPILAQTEAQMEIFRCPDSAAGKQQRAALEGFVDISLRCVGPSQMRPSLREVLSSLDTMYQAWSCRSALDDSPVDDA